MFFNIFFRYNIFWRRRFNPKSSSLNDSSLESCRVSFIFGLIIYLSVARQPSSKTSAYIGLLSNWRYRPSWSSFRFFIKSVFCFEPSSLTLICYGLLCKKWNSYCASFVLNEDVEILSAALFSSIMCSLWPSSSAARIFIWLSMNFLSCSCLSISFKSFYAEFLVSVKLFFITFCGGNIFDCF